jgi:ethanolamine ammonia-lyase large subunit
MSLSLGKSVAVSTSMIRSNPAVPIYKGDEIYAVIYHIEIEYNQNNNQNTKQYIIIDYKEFNLSNEEKEKLIKVAKQYCESKNIADDEHLEIALLDNEEAENFLEKIFNNMKVIRGLITKKD